MKIKAARYTFIILFTISCLSIFANGEDSVVVKKDRQHKSIAIYYQQGFVLPFNDFVKGENAKGEPIEKFRSFSAQFATETDGRKLWQQLYAYPSWGFGISAFNFYKNDEIGNPWSLYAFFNAPFFRLNKMSLNYFLGGGLSYNWNPYHPVDNPYNKAIGSKSAYYLDFGIHLNFQLGKHLDLMTGFTFTHSSNGSSKLPNLGLNLASPRITLKYTIKGHPDKIKKEIIPKFKKQWEFIGLFAYSHKQVEFDTLWSDSIAGIVNDYSIYNLSATINYQISYKVKFGAGMDFGYDEAYNSYVTYENQQVIKQDGEGNKFSVGIYPSFELVIHKFSAIVQSGWYIYRSEPIVKKSTDENYEIHPHRKPGNSYQKIGIKFHILNNLFIGISLRSFDFTIADYVEWNIGYRILK